MHYLYVTMDMRVCLQELQKAYDKRKAIVLSINLCSAEFLHSETDESRELQGKLKDMNNHWDKLGSALEEWRSSLQEALMQCQVSADQVGLFEQIDLLMSMNILL